MSLETRQNIILDFTVPKIKNVRCVEDDKNSRIINISITNNGELYPLSKSTMIARYKIHKPDHTYIYNEVPINDDGTVTIELSEQAMAVTGITHSELQVSDSSTKSIISTMPFNIIVEKSVVGNKDIESSNESDVINGMINHLVDYNNPHKIPDATTETKGLTQLENSVSSTSVTNAATPNSVKTVNDSLTAEVNRATTAENNLDSKKANIESPTLTGAPKAPTAVAGTNSNQIATTAFMQTAIENHNASSLAHKDIRDLISFFSTKLNTLCDSDDTTLDQLNEIVTYIKSNRSLIENVTTKFINKTGGTFTGSVDFNGGVRIWKDNEGGNIEITSSLSDGSYYQMDAINGRFRIYYGNNTSENTASMSLTSSGVLSATGGFKGVLDGKATNADYLNIQNGNEINFKGNDNCSNKKIWFNYRSADTADNTTNAITDYFFGNGQKGTTGVTLNADNFSGNAASANVIKMPRVTKNVSYQPGANKFVCEEFSKDSEGLPSAQWYHVFTGQGSDANYNTQLALGMSTTAMYYRNRQVGTWGTWQEIPLSTNGVLNIQSIIIPSYLRVGRNSGTGVELAYNSEGGNIAWFAPDGTKWEFDCYNNNFRLFNYSTYKNFIIDKSGNASFPANLGVIGALNVTGAVKTSGSSGVWAGEKIKMWSDNEGGNLEITSNTGNTYWQMDAGSDVFRIYQHNNSTGANYFPLNIYGNTTAINTLTISNTINGYNIGGTVAQNNNGLITGGNVYSALGNVQIVEIFNTGLLSTSAAITNGATATLSISFSMWPGATNYIVIPTEFRYCHIENTSVSDNKLNITVRNISGASHTLSAMFQIIYYKYK